MNIFLVKTTRKVMKLMKIKNALALIIVSIASIYTYTIYINSNNKVINVQKVEQVANAINESPNVTLEMKCLLDAICEVESNCDPSAIGDNGASIGAYQIQYNYWFDAVEWDPSLSSPIFEYNDCFDKEYSEFIMIAYMERYVPEAMEYFDPEVIARTHNGGPNGFAKDSTIKYWEKIKPIFNERKYGK